MYCRVLVPTDGSSGIDGAIEHAFAVAERFDAAVHALSVVGEEGDADAAAAAVEAVADRGADRDIEVVTAVRRGTPHVEILDYATEADIDLAVMGTAGWSNVGRVFPGSVTERVLRAGELPVLTVRLDDHRALDDEETAIEAAREAVADEGYAVAAVPERPYRERGTWVVRVETDSGPMFNVHVNARTAGTRLARIRAE
jgi:nucleotide-binding universal stress UspA family protein